MWRGIRTNSIKKQSAFYLNKWLTCRPKTECFTDNKVINFLEEIYNLSGERGQVPVWFSVSNSVPLRSLRPLRWLRGVIVLGAEKMPSYPNQAHQAGTLRIPAGYVLVLAHTKQVIERFDLLLMGSFLSHAPLGRPFQNGAN